MARIVVLIGNHLSTAPRPVKEADALARAGHDVHVLGVWSDPGLAARDEEVRRGRAWTFRPLLDLRPRSARAALRRLRHRASGRLARARFGATGAAGPALLGFGVRAALRAVRAERPDLAIVHSEGGLWVADRLIEEGVPVGVDFEDWFSEDLLPEARASRPVAELRRLEERVLRQAVYRVTTSRALAAALAAEYGVPEPRVVYNAFPPPDPAAGATAGRDRRDPRLPSLHWFSQTIGAGRGLEVLCAALGHMRVPAEVHVRGEGREWLVGRVPEAWRERFFVHPTVGPGELPHRIAEHDVGLALDPPDPRSRDLTITNKLFQYLGAGLAVVACDTAGHREIFREDPAAASIVAPRDAEGLAAALDALLGSRDRLAAAKAAARRLAVGALSWESQEAAVVAEARTALGAAAGKGPRGKPLHASSGV